MPGVVQGGVVIVTLVREGCVFRGGNQETETGMKVVADARRAQARRVEVKDNKGIWRGIEARERAKASDARNVMSFRDVLLLVGVGGTGPENEASVR